VSARSTDDVGWGVPRSYVVVGWGVSSPLGVGLCVSARSIEVVGWCVSARSIDEVG